MSSHTDPEVIGTIWFDDASSYPQTVALIEEASELLWGANDDGTREPYSIEESIERMKEYTLKSYAWDLLVEHFFVADWDMDSDTQEKYEMRELMDRLIGGEEE